MYTHLCQLCVPTGSHPGSSFWVWAAEPPPPSWPQREKATSGCQQVWHSRPGLHPGLALPLQVESWGLWSPALRLQFQDCWPQTPVVACMPGLASSSVGGGRGWWVGQALCSTGETEAQDAQPPLVLSTVPPCSRTWPRQHLSLRPALGTHPP